MFNVSQTKRQHILMQAASEPEQDHQPQPNDPVPPQQLDGMPDLGMIAMDSLINQVAAGLDTIFITGPVDMESATIITKQLLIIEQRNQITGFFEPIKMVINSPGGDLHAAWMISDIMDSIETPVWTYGFGHVISAGIMLFMNGEYGHRYCTKNTQFMSHRCSMGLVGGHADLQSQKFEIDRVHKRIIEHYVKCTGLSKVDIETMLLSESDKWLSANNCKKLNIVDKIMKVNSKSYITNHQPKKKKKAKKVNARRKRS